MHRQDCGPLKPFHTKIRPQVLEHLKQMSEADGKYIYRLIEDAILFYFGSQADGLRPDAKTIGSDLHDTFIDQCLDWIEYTVGPYNGEWPDENEEEVLARIEVGDNGETKPLHK